MLQLSLKVSTDVSNLHAKLDLENKKNGQKVDEAGEQEQAPSCKLSFFVLLRFLVNSMTSLFFSCGF